MKPLLKLYYFPDNKLSEIGFIKSLYLCRKATVLRKCRENYLKIKKYDSIATISSEN